MNSGLFEVLGISSPRNYMYQMDIPVAKGKVQCSSQWECGIGVQGSFEAGHEREKGKRADMVTILLLLSSWGKRNWCPD